MTVLRQDAKNAFRNMINQEQTTQTALLQGWSIKKQRRIDCHVGLHQKNIQKNMVIKGLNKQEDTEKRTKKNTNATE